MLHGKRPAWVVAALALSTTAGFATAAETERGKELAQACIACHGPNGAGVAAANFPRLDILAASYMVKQLQDIKSGARQSPIMQPVAAELNAQQMRDVSAYYAAQSAKPAEPAAADPELLRLGEKLLNRGDWDRYLPACNACHGPGGKGVGSAFPALAGQHASYIATQLRAWQNGGRNNDPMDLMLAIAERMNETDIKATAAWLAAQPAK